MRRALALLCLLALLATASVAHAAGLGKLLGTDTARGSGATASTAASIELPKAIYVKATVSPRQEIIGSYTVICSKDGRRKSRSVGFDGTGTVTAKVQAPIPGADECSIGAAAGILESGTVTVKIFGR